MSITMQIGKCPPDKPFGRANGVQRIGFLCGKRSTPDFRFPVFRITDNGRQRNAAVFIRQADRTSAEYGGNQAVGRTQVYADGEAVLVGGGGFAGFGDLE